MKKKPIHTKTKMDELPILCWFLVTAPTGVANWIWCIARGRHMCCWALTWRIVSLFHSTV